MLSSDLLSWFWIAPILAGLIVAHELGHFVAARLCGVTVEEFGLGNPPRLAGFRWRGVLWSINSIPFGGFVRVKGEDGRDPGADSMHAKSPGQRAFFLTAGVVMNVLLAVAIAVAVLAIRGVPHGRLYLAETTSGGPAARAGWQAGDRIVAVEGRAVEHAQDFIAATTTHRDRPMRVMIERRGKLIDSLVVPRHDPESGTVKVGVTLDAATMGDVHVRRVVDGSSAAAAGLRSGDLIVAINDRPALDDHVLGYELLRHAGATLPLTVERDGRLIEVALAVPAARPHVDPAAVAGLSAVTFSPIFERVSPIEAVPRGIGQTVTQTRLMLVGLTQLLTGEHPLSDMLGPGGMAHLTHELLQTTTLPAWMALANLAVVLSLNLALLNLLPFPALDGGRLAFVVVEVIRGGRRVAPEKEGLVHLVGMAALLIALLAITVGDVHRIVSGGSVLL